MANRALFRMPLCFHDKGDDAVSNIFDIAHEMAQDLLKVEALGGIAIDELDALCLPSNFYLEAMDTRPDE